MKLKLASVGIPVSKFRDKSIILSEVLLLQKILLLTLLKFTQIYFVGDDKVQSSLRQTVIQGLRSDIVNQLQHMLHQSNCYTRSLKMAVDILSCHSHEFKVIIDADKRPSGKHERRFNALLCNEVGVLMLGLYNFWNFTTCKR